MLGSMDYQRENGRINGLRTKRQHAKEFAEKMVPLLAQARKEAPEKYPGEGYALRTIADWLNNQDPPVPAKGGGRWQPTQITRLLQTHILLVEDIEKQFELEYQVREYVRATPDYPDRERVLANLTEIELKREDAIREARQLGADLAGTPYAEIAIPMPQFYRADPNPASTHLNRALERAERRLTQNEEKASEEWAKAKADWALVAEDMQKLRPNASVLVAGLSPADPRQQYLIERQRKVDAVQLRIALRREATRRVKSWINRQQRDA